MRSALARRDRGEPLEDPDITFAALFDEWLTSKKRKARTVEIYRDTFHYYIKPTFENAAISSTNSRAVQKWVSSLVNEDYDSDTVRLAFAVFRGAVRYALDHEMLLKNPLAAVEVPKKEKRKANVLEPDEAVIRSFTLPASFMAWLKEHRQAQLEQRTRLGRDWADYDLVFSNEVGDPLQPNAYRALWKRVLTRAGMTGERMKMRPYDARHTVATLLLLQRTPSKVVTALSTCVHYCLRRLNLSSRD